MTMPAPHCADDKHEHWSVVESKVGQVGRLLVFAGNAAALAWRRATNCAGVRFAFTERISAATPATIGAEKLVPKLGLESPAFANSLV